MPERRAHNSRPPAVCLVAGERDYLLGQRLRWLPATPAAGPGLYPEWVRRSPVTAAYDLLRFETRPIYLSRGYEFPLTALRRNDQHRSPKED
jgi:hypothetical protein